MKNNKLKQTLNPDTSFFFKTIQIHNHELLMINEIIVEVVNDRKDEVKTKKDVDS